MREMRDDDLMHGKVIPMELSRKEWVKLIGKEFVETVDFCTETDDPNFKAVIMSEIAYWLDWAIPPMLPKSRMEYVKLVISILDGTFEWS